MKKLTALILALAMTIFLVSPALADTGEPDGVRMNVRVAEGSHLALPVEYTFSLVNAKKFMNATIFFEVDGTMLEGGDLTFLAENFSAMDREGGPIVWSRKDGDTWQGELLVMYLDDPDGFTAAPETDIFKLSCRAKQLGDATLRVTDVRIVALDETDKAVYVTGEIGDAATTEVALPAAIYSIYDLNRDGVIDERDLAMAQRYYLVAVGDGSWGAAQACDFNGDGIVNMLDLIDLFRNFGIAVTPDVPPGVITMGSLSAMELLPDGSDSVVVSATASNGQAVQITAQSEDQGVATVSVNDGSLTVRAVALGTTTIQVTASAPNCLDVVRRFAVTVTTGEIALTGTAIIDNTSPKVGDILTASLINSNNTGTLHFAWKADGEPVGTDSDTYTVAAADLGKTITVTIASNVEAGAVTSAATAAVANQEPGGVVTPVAAVTGSTWITLATVDGYEYACAEKDGPVPTIFQSNPAFGGLTADTEYDFYQRIAATADTDASPVTEKLTARTLPVSGDKNPLTFTVEANDGESGRADTTEIYVNVSANIDELKMENVMISNVSGKAILNQITGFATEWTLLITVLREGEVVISIRDFTDNLGSWAIATPPQTVMVYQDMRPQVSFTAQQAGGVLDTETTTGIALAFDVPVEGLTAAHITLTNGTGAVTMGALDGAGTDWLLAVTVAAAGTVEVSVADFGDFRVMNAGPATVTVFEKLAQVGYAAAQGRRGTVVAVEGDKVTKVLGGEDVTFAVPESVTEFRFVEIISAGAGYYYALSKQATLQGGAWVFRNAPGRVAVLGRFEGERSEIIGNLLPDLVLEEKYILVTQQAE